MLPRHPSRLGLSTTHQISIQCFFLIVEGARVSTNFIAKSECLLKKIFFCQFLFRNYEIIELCWLSFLKLRVKIMNCLAFLLRLLPSRESSGLVVNHGLWNAVKKNFIKYFSPLSFGSPLAKIIFFCHDVSRNFTPFSPVDFNLFFS